jgi:hypothetical protein
MLKKTWPRRSPNFAQLLSHRLQCFYLIGSLLLKKSSMRQLMKRQVDEMTWHLIFNGNERKWYLTSSPSFEITASSPARPEGPEEAEVSPLTSAFAFLGPLL